MGQRYIYKMVIILSGVGLLLSTATEVFAAKKYLSLATGNPGGTFYFIGAGFANLFNKYVPDVRVIAESTAASEENFHYVIRKKVDMGLISIHVIEPALEKKMDLSVIKRTARLQMMPNKTQPVAPLKIVKQNGV